VTVNSNLRRRPTPTLLTTTTTTTTTNTTLSETTTAATTTDSTASGDSAGSRVLPPVNVSDLLSKDELRQQTERVYWQAVHKVAASAHSDSTATSTVGHKDATHTSVDTVDAAESDSVVMVSDNEDSCDNMAETKTPEVSANVGSDSVDAMVLD